MEWGGDTRGLLIRAVTDHPVVLRFLQLMHSLAVLSIYIPMHCTFEKNAMKIYVFGHLCREQVQYSCQEIAKWYLESVCLFICLYPLDYAHNSG